MTDLDVEIELRVRERTAHLEAVNQELESFVAAVVRDLRSPLRAIQGVTHVLVERHGDGADGARECVDCIQLNVEQMSRMLDGLTRICSGDKGGHASPGDGKGRSAGKGGQSLCRQEPAREGGPTVQESLDSPAGSADFDVGLKNLRQRDTEGNA